MYFIQLKRTQFFYLLLALILLIGFWGIVKAEEDYFVLDQEIVETTQDESSLKSKNTQIYDFDEDSNLNQAIRSKSEKNPLLVSNSFFVAPDGITLSGLIGRVCFIVFFLIGILILIKIIFLRNQFHTPGNLFENLAQRVSNTFSSFSNPSSLKLVQTLILTPGQNLYVVEVGEKKLLLGGTHQGGIQFLADITKTYTFGNLDLKQIENIQNQNSVKHVQSDMPKGPVTQKIEKSFNLQETPFITNEKTSEKVEKNGQDKTTKSNLNQETSTSISSSYSTQALKRRLSFRQSLLSNMK